MLNKAKRDVLINITLPGSIHNFRIVCFNDLRIGKLKDGRSQGGFIAFLVDDNNIASLSILRHSVGILFLMETDSCIPRVYKDEQPLQGVELQGKDEAKDEKKGDERKAKDEKVD